MMHGKFWKTPALFELPRVLLEEQQTTKPQPSQQHLLNKATQELDSYVRIVKDLQLELSDSSLPYDNAEAISQKLQHFKRMAAIADFQIRNYKQHRKQMIEMICVAAAAQLRAVSKSCIEMLSDEEELLLNRSCERHAKTLLDRPTLDPQSSAAKVRVFILEKRILPDLNYEGNEEVGPLRLYQSGLITIVRKDKAQIAEKEGYLMILKGQTTC